MTRVLVYSDCNSFQEYVDTLVLALREHGYESHVVTTLDPTSRDYHIVFGLNCAHVPILSPHFTYVQLEQLCSHWLTPTYLKRLQSVATVWEFSASYTRPLQELGVRATHVPLGRVMREEPREQTEEALDILFTGCINSHRAEWLTALTDAGLNVTILTNTYGIEKEGYLRRARIVLNLHYYQNATIEQLRIIPALAAGIMVISETCTDTLPIAEFANSPAEMVTLCQHWLRASAEERRQRARELYSHVPLFSQVLPWSQLAQNVITYSAALTRTSATALLHSYSAEASSVLFEASMGEAALWAVLAGLRGVRGASLTVVGNENILPQVVARDSGISCSYSVIPPLLLRTDLVVSTNLELLAHSRYHYITKDGTNSNSLSEWKLLGATEELVVYQRRRSV